MNNFFLGVFITSVLQLSDLPAGTNAVGFIPENSTQLTEYLDTIDNTLTPVIGIDTFYKENGVYTYKSPQELKTALSNSKHFSGVVFMLNEPCWYASHMGQSCDDALAVFSQVKKDFPLVEFFHVEAYPELDRQMATYGHMKFLPEADHVGFDCYRPFHDCYGKDHFYYLANLYNSAYVNNHNIKVFVVPGAFVHPSYMPTVNMTIQHIRDYVDVVTQYKEFVSGVGFFTWGDVDDIKGASHNYLLREEIQKSFKVLQ